MTHGEPVAEGQSTTSATPDPETGPEATPPPNRRPRRRWPLWTALVVVLLVAAGLAVPASAVRGAESRTSPGVVARAENPTTRAARQFAARITGQLDRQSAALLRGDRAGFLAIAERGLHTDLSRRFATLRALRVSGWQARPKGLPTQAGRPGEWRLTVEFQYCFAVPDCRPSSLFVETRWRDSGAQPRLLEMARSSPDQYLPGRMDQVGSLPWEMSQLVAVMGKRTLVATTPQFRKRLPELLARAEAAAKVADQYVVAGDRPDRYRIYYAGPKEWKRWYGGRQPDWAAGYAIGIGGGHREIVVKDDRYTPAGLDELLRHELAHAASLPDHDYRDESTWWLVEGLAEYAGADGRAISRYFGLSATRRLVNRGWDRKLDTVAPGEDDPDARVTGSYGIAYLAVRYLVDRFGEERVFAFVKAVVHDRRIPRQTSEAVLGVPWSTLHADCVKYIRGVAD
ncbi:hypothetical protein [Micromonospora sp. NPDC126480]|uniref:hypothetical protein n=1 Tax=Micromonospora sp. NPDC126480 TaxID=3155312 RepID=UPI003332EA45